MKLSKLFILLIFASSCSSKKEQLRYKYFDELNNYLVQHHSINILSEEALYLLAIPVGSCTPCVKESLTMAVEQVENKELKTILMADNKKIFNEYNHLIKLLNSRTTFYDYQGNRNDFETGIFSPTIFYFVKGRLIYYKELTVSNIPYVKKDLKWK